MGHISILIVDDDITKISLIIDSIKTSISEILTINQASNVTEAIEFLQNNEIHLLITDFQIPLRFNETPDNDGGVSLIKSLYKKKTNANMPMFIVGLTQFETLQRAYTGVWKVWRYNPSENDWRINIRDLLHHISLVKSRVITQKIETIFVEGITDKRIFQKTIELYYPEFINKVEIRATNQGGGASWVERQILIWSKTLSMKNGEDNYLKAVGVLDNDDAGNEAMFNIRKVIKSNSVECNTFSLVQTNSKYSPLLKSIKFKNLNFSTTIEDLLPIKLFKEARSLGYLKERSFKSFEYQNERLVKLPSQEFMESTGFSNDEILITINKLDDDYKSWASNQVLNMSKDDLLNISYLLKDVFIKLKLMK